MQLTSLTKHCASRCALAAAGAALPALAPADTPPTARTQSESTFAFGDVSIKQSYNSMKDPTSPEFKLRVYNKGKLVLELNDAGFDNFYPAPDNQAFVGLSNQGWPATAAIVFDKNGKVLLLARHGTTRFGYCMETSTFLKLWYDAQDPQVRFLSAKPAPGKAPGITLRDCKGATVNLLDIVSGAAERR
ncbi:hypothetical protein ASC94_12385 [Massilia sp. Root418]|nr:hypothetical protein ASC94_12385 [Massilia sp. Root418]